MDECDMNSSDHPVIDKHSEKEVVDFLAFLQNQNNNPPPVENPVAGYPQ